MYDLGFKSIQFRAGHTTHSTLCTICTHLINGLSSKTIRWKLKTNISVPLESNKSFNSFIKIIISNNFLCICFLLAVLCLLFFCCQFTEDKLNIHETEATAFYDEGKMPQWRQVQLWSALLKSLHNLHIWVLHNENRNGHCQ